MYKKKYVSEKQPQHFTKIKTCTTAFIQATNKKISHIYQTDEMNANQ